LGYELNYLTLEGSKIPSRFLKVYKQQEVGAEGYDAGAEQLRKFFKQELQSYLTPELLQTGKRIIDACLSDATTEEYNALVPMSYQYSFTNMESYEQRQEFPD
jgi:ethanolamine ammonia-lyase large subunit